MSFPCPIQDQESSFPRVLSVQRLSPRWCFLDGKCISLLLCLAQCLLLMQMWRITHLRVPPRRGSFPSCYAEQLKRELCASLSPLKNETGPSFSNQSVFCSIVAPRSHVLPRVVWDLCYQHLCCDAALITWQYLDSQCRWLWQHTAVSKTMFFIPFSV